MWYPLLTEDRTISHETSPTWAHAIHQLVQAVQRLTAKLEGYASTWSHSCTSTHARMCRCACTRTHTRTHTHTHTHARTCKHTHIHTHTQAHANTHTYTYTRTCKHTHTHTHTTNSLSGTSPLLLDHTSQQRSPEQTVPSAQYREDKVGITHYAKVQTLMSMLTWCSPCCNHVVYQLTTSQITARSNKDTLTHEATRLF